MKSITEIFEKVKAKELLLARIKELEQVILSNFLDENERNTIEKEILNLKSIVSINTYKNLNEIDPILEKFDLDFQAVENAQFSYIYDNFIVKNEITMFAAKPASGKSLIALALSKIACENDMKIIYFDADNGITTLKERNIHKLKERFNKENFRYFHESSISKLQMFNVIAHLQKCDLSETFIVFDSIKNFMNGGDRDKNKDVSKIFDVLKSLRKNGATILFLHHTNKPQRDAAELAYAGSSAFEEDTSNAFILTRNDYQKSFMFKVLKNRVGELKDIAFLYDSENHQITEIDINEAKITEEHQFIKDEIVEFLTNQKQKQSYSQIMQHLQKSNFINKDKNNFVIQAYKEKVWRVEKLKQNNKDLFELIQKESDSVKNKETSKISYFSSDKSNFGGLQKEDRSSLVSDKCNVLQDKHSYQNMNISIPKI